MPTLPTDSLYKFLFVFGIVLTISIQYISFQNDDARRYAYLQKEKYLTALSEKYKKLTISTENSKNTLKQETAEITEEIRRIKMVDRKKAGELLKEIVRKKNIRGKTDSGINEKFRVNDSLYHEIEKNDSLISIEMDGTISVLEAKNRLYNYLSVVGIILAVIGGLLWYFMIQQYQDRMLLLQKMQLEKEINAKPKFTGRPHYSPGTFIKPRK